ncbi:MAG: FeoA domain-containing protein, partial [Anaerolineaceae bacterium]|nr:FeoA domain-containing protein [Anaerolineaceae bacterium]
MNNNSLSESEQMYLVTIRKACEHCADTPIPIPEIAKELGVQPVSASQMINRLAERGVVNYIPYKGAELTPEGKAISDKILRNRRLWEVFLVKVLEMELEEADRLACQIEHFTSPDITSRLANFLDHPTVCFHGDPIPQIEGGNPVAFEGIPLDKLKVGQRSHVVRINADPPTAKFLADEGVKPGVCIGMLATGNSGDYLLEIGENRIHLSAKMTGDITVSSITHAQQPEKEEQDMEVPLSHLKVGDRGIVRKLNFKGGMRQRLLAMGLTAGEIISVKRIAPLGDPIDFVIKGYDLSLRKNEAKEISVTLVQE